MRVIYVNLHTNTFFLRNFEFILFKRRAIDKHRFILDWMIENDVPVVNFVTLNGTSIPGKIFRRITRHKLFRELEAKLVLRKNGIDNTKVSVISDYKKIKDDDVIIIYGHFSQVQTDINLEMNGIKVADHIHFYGDKETSDRLKNLGIKYYMSEIDLNKYCGIYKQNYSWFHGKYIPRKFAYHNRFTVIKPFCERKNLALAIGTLTYCNDKDFIEYYGQNVYQPIRKLIFDNAKILKGYVDSYISEFQETPKKIVNNGEFPLVSIYKKLFNYFNTGKQKRYFSFDMVQKYNEYMMFICPEDAHGQYGIGVVEGMACGCAMIGWNYGVYEDLGLRDGVNYIAYDGTIDDLINKIKYYQSPDNFEKLQAIANNGCKFIREKFSQSIVAQEYIDSLSSLK